MPEKKKNLLFTVVSTFRTCERSEGKVGCDFLPLLLPPGAAGGTRRDQAGASSLPGVPNVGDPAPHGVTPGPGAAAVTAPQELLMREGGAPARGVSPAGGATSPPTCKERTIQQDAHLKRHRQRANPHPCLQKTPGR